MINKRNLMKIFIVFFMINMFYFTSNISHASISLSTTSIELTIGETKKITVSGSPGDLGNSVTFQRETIAGVPHDGAISTSCKSIMSSNPYQFQFEVTITGTSAGEAYYKAKVGSETSGQQLHVKVKGPVTPAGPVGVYGKGDNVIINTDVLREDFADEFSPESPGGHYYSDPVINVIIPVVNRVLAILQILGAILLVIELAIAGINGVLGAGDGISEDLGLSVGSSYNQYGLKVEGVQNLTAGALSKILRRAFIGTAILELSATIVRIVFNVCTNL